MRPSRFSRPAAAAALLCLATSVARAADPPTPPIDRVLYDTPALFDQLSGAARARLERRFGTKGAKPGDQPAAVQPAKVRVFPEPQTAVANVLVNDPAADATAQDTQNETTLVLGNAGTVIASFNDSGSNLIGSDPGGNQFTGWARSTDGGTGFTDRGRLTASSMGDAGDPVLVRSTKTGTVLLATLGFTDDAALPIFRSVDDGATLLAPVNGSPGFVTGIDSQDKEWLAVDNNAGTAYGNVYMFWRNFSSTGANDGMTFSRSTDDGLTWATVGRLAAGGQGAWPVVGADHAVYAFWYDSSGAPRKISFRKSTDAGLTFGPTTTAVSLVGTGTNGDLGLNGGFRSSSFPQVVTHPTDASKLYLVVNDKGGAGDKADVYLSVSTNGGTSWSALQRVNSDATINDQFMPVVAIAPDGSRLFVSWYDRRRDPSNSRIEVFGTIGTIAPAGTVTFGANFALSTGSWPVVIGQDPRINSVYMGDYDAAVADATSFYRTWGDNRLASTAHANQPDTRFAKIPQAGPGAILLLSSSAVSGGNANGGIDPNECVDLSVTLTNAGSAAAGGVNATVTTSTAGVTVSQPESGYAAIAPGALGTNVQPFRLTTSPAFACGTPIDLTVTVTTALDGAFVLPLRLTTGSGVGPAVRVDSNAVTPIPDNNATGVEIPVTVAGVTTPVASLTVSQRITHSYDGDLLVSLVAPDASAAVLSNRRGGSGDDFGSACAPDASRTTFDDAAATAIASGTAPFLGSFKPDEALARFTGAVPNGTWKLRVSDRAASDTGSVQCWSLSVVPVTCTPGSGACACPAISISPTSLPSGTQGTSYSQPLSQTGAISPTWSVQGTLPPGLTLDPSTGVLSGTPTSSGSYDFVVVATASGCSGSRAYSISIVGLPPTFGGIAPACGSAAGGTPVTISGTNFAAGATVTIGGIAAVVGTVTPTSISATTGAHARGTATVVVTNPDLGTAVGSNAYSYVLRGDADGNGVLTFADVIRLQAALFGAGPQPSCVVEGDADGNGSIGASDLTYLNQYLYAAGPPPGP